MTAISYTRRPGHAAAYILQAKLSNPFFRFSSTDFITWFCFQFRIPQPARLGNANAAGVEQCLGSCRQRDVDLHGNHAHAPCRVCKLGRGHRHRYLKAVVSHHAIKAGCTASWVTEASTPALLNHQFTPKECSIMFPRKPRADMAKRARQLRPSPGQASHPRHVRVAEASRLRDAELEAKPRDEVVGGEAKERVGELGLQNVCR